MWKCPSSIRYQDSNPRPLGFESPPITTRPGLSPMLLSFPLLSPLYFTSSSTSSLCFKVTYYLICVSISLCFLSFYLHFFLSLSVCLSLFSLSLSLYHNTSFLFYFILSFFLSLSLSLSPRSRSIMARIPMSWQFLDWAIPTQALVQDTINFAQRSTVLGMRLTPLPG